MFAIFEKKKMKFLIFKIDKKKSLSFFAKKNKKKQMSDDDWLKNLSLVLHLARGLCVGNNPQLTLDCEFIKNTQLALPFRTDDSIPIRVRYHKVETHGVFALQKIPKAGFVTAFPGDVVRCETKTSLIYKSERFQASLDADLTTTPGLQLNEVMWLHSSVKLIDDPRYLAHVIRQAPDPQQANCAARMLHSGLQVLFFATREIDENEEILCDWPMNQKLQSLCFVCLDREKPVRKCGRCKFAAYCSRECQTIHWPQHKHMCF